MAEADFLSFLVDETLKLQKSGEVELSSLELKLSDYKLNFLKGEFIPQLQMIRFITSFGKIDIPVNWSIFALETGLNGDVVLSDEKDEDHLFKVLKSCWDQNFSKMLITHSDGFCYLVGLHADEEAHLHDLLNPQVWLKNAA
jgi:hypothetical protein